MKEKNKRIRLFALLLAVLMLASCAAPTTTPASSSAVSSEKADTQEVVEKDKRNDYTIERLTRDAEVPMGKEGTWTIFIYMCGADLESEGSMASFNLHQIMQNPPSKNVNFVVQTGGAKQWGQPMPPEAGEPVGHEGAFPSQIVDPDKLQRYTVTDKMTLVDEQELASMGDQDTLYDFLSWGVENYPAENMGVVFWNHGSGSLRGVCFDELFESDSLLLFEMENAFERVHQEMTDKFEFVGFDACLMANIETANVLVPHARYMYASEEVEAGYGWNYANITNTLAQNPTIDGAGLGTALCDGFFEFYKELDATDSMLTLSVVDLSKIDQVLYALDDLAKVLDENFSDPQFFGEASRKASRAQSYYADYMVDLGDMAEKMKSLVPQEAEALYSAVENSVVHSVSGASTAYSNGLSVFYPNTITRDNTLMYGFNYATPAYYSYLNRIQYAKLKLLLSGEQLVKIAQEPSKDDEGKYTMTIRPDTTDYVQQLLFMLFLAPQEGGEVYNLGYDNDLNMDWASGKVQDNFKGKWAQIGGELLMIELKDFTDEYNIYTSPILLNGQRTNLQLKWVWAEGEQDNGHYEILGTWDGVDSETGMASRTSRPLSEGDTVTPLYEALPYDVVTSEEIVDPEEYRDENGERILAEGTSVVVKEDTKVIHAPIEEGQYLYQFAVIDVYGEQITYAPEELEVSYSGVTINQNAENDTPAAA